MRIVFFFLFLLACVSAGAQTDAFGPDDFSEGEFYTGVVFLEMTVSENNGKSKIEFDFGNSEKSSALRKEALWDEELNRELEFNSVVDALNHLETKQWTTRNMVVDKNGEELFKYFLLEKIAGF